MDLQSALFGYAVGLLVWAIALVSAGSGVEE